MIIGVTHDQDGRVVQRLSVSTKVSIGLPPNGDRNHPTKLDHFVFLRKKKSANRVEWEADPELTRHYGEQCRELHIMLIDDDIENVFLREEGTYFGRKEKRKKTSSIWALSLEVEGEDMRKLIANLTAARRLATTKKQAIGEVVEWASGGVFKHGDVGRMTEADTPKLRAANELMAAALAGAPR
jgi:hypothetical protein